MLLDFLSILNPNLFFVPDSWSRQGRKRQEILKMNKLNIMENAPRFCLVWQIIYVPAGTVGSLQRLPLKNTVITAKQNALFSALFFSLALRSGGPPGR